MGVGEGEMVVWGGGGGGGEGGTFQIDRYNWVIIITITAG